MWKIYLRNKEGQADHVFLDACDAHDAYNQAQAKYGDRVFKLVQIKSQLDNKQIKSILEAIVVARAKQDFPRLEKLYACLPIIQLLKLVEAE